ncbi:hypothetical protein QPK87_27750 [Kamptonema cortianum]|nr:hypothetical protein [Oscillatoria laete-virens]MDK3160323.1 hypothetical protein [Kamptonema cortianum]MDL5053706.1 hypothetical protein [Oscillatoria laete-virens NRMC-F 0139]
MGGFKHFIDKLFGTIFKIIIIGALIVGGYILWNGWGNAAMSDEQVKQFEKENNVKLTEAQRKEGFSGVKKIYTSVDEELMGAQIESERGSNVNRKEKADE